MKDVPSGKPMNRRKETKFPAKKSQRSSLALLSPLRLLPVILGFIVRWFLGVSVTTILLYQVVASPPLHLWFPVREPAGPSSVYVPGSGFSGVWFHLGFLQSLPSLHEHTYYCYSSGCLSVLMAIMNTTLEKATDTAHSIQSSWMNGTISRYDLVDHFLDHLLGDSIEIDHFLDRLHVLVTSTKDGVAVEKASNSTHLKELLLKTTYIPFITGPGLGFADQEAPNVLHIDGAFSKTLHPKCDLELHIPLTLWDVSQHILNPALDRDKVQGIWLTGQQYRQEIFASA